MNIVMEEKKYSILSYGTAVANAYFLYPRIDGAQKISDFYENFAYELYCFFEKAAKAYQTDYENADRAQRRDHSPFCMRLFSSVLHAEQDVLSISQEYVASIGKEILFYKKLCYVWDTGRELLLPARRFFSRRDAKKAEKNEFYIDAQNAVIVENLFPHTVGADGRRLRLCDYIRETKRERRNISASAGEQS